MIIIPSDVAGFLDLDNVCVRTGHLCVHSASNKHQEEKEYSE